MDPGPWTPSVEQVYQKMDKVPLSWNRFMCPIFLLSHIFTTPYKQLVCFTTGSHLHATLPALSFASNMGGVDERKHCSFLLECRVLMIFSTSHVLNEYWRNVIKMSLYERLQSWKLIKHAIEILLWIHFFNLYYRVYLHVLYLNFILILFYYC